MNEPHEIDLYTSLEEAKQEIRRRWNDESLRKEVAAFIGTELPFLAEEPKACLFRYITTPNFELFKFIEIANEIQLKPVALEYLNDCFASRNRDKYALGKLHFYCQKDKLGRIIYSRKTIVDFNKFGGKPLRSVQTLWNESLVDFHHRLLHNCQLKDFEIVDMSNWFGINGGKAKNYYLHFLAFFICNGVLFENFVTNSEEERFSREVVFPAFTEVTKYFGLKPLVVPLLPHDEASDIYWCLYSLETKAVVLEELWKQTI